MDKCDECHSFPFIDGNGTLDVAGIENFVKKAKLAEHGLSYSVASIIGPQSSGKSTLLNHVFGMRPLKEFGWQNLLLAKRCTLVMDLEGADGSEREDDTAFERQSALFALAVSDIMILNMWCHDLGRDKAANRPLLKTIIQVMMRLFKPHKTTLMFTPLEKLEDLLTKDIEKIWNSTHKPQAYTETPFRQFFNVEIVALSSFKHNLKQFKEEVASLRQRIIDSVALGDRKDIVPASDFSFSAKQKWKDIKENKDLDLPAHTVMVATVRCEEIANKKLDAFVADKELCQLIEAVKSRPVPGFGKKLSSILDAYLSEYEAEATYFDEGVRIAKGKQLKEKLLQHVRLAHQSMLGQIQSKTLDKFKEEFDKALNGGEVFSVAARDCIKSCMAEFDEGCKDAVIEQANWDFSKERDKLRLDIDAHVAAVQDATLLELTTQHKEKLDNALSGPVKYIFDSAGYDTWQKIRELLGRKAESAVSGFSVALSAFDMDEQTKGELLVTLKDYANTVVEAKAKEGAGRILISMKDKFAASFNHDSRVWSGEEDIPAITETARSASLKWLSIMAAIRLDDRPDNIKNTLFDALLSADELYDTLASSTWEEVPLSKTLIAPLQCRSLWGQFKEETKYIVNQAMAAKEAIERARMEAGELRRSYERVNRQARELRGANERANEQIRRANEQAREVERNNRWSLASWRLVGVLVSIVTATVGIVGADS
ncbi:hypothetical protein F0562_025353 [Nyssa sinensis]|uniref:GB1/RHD3-type G domain-containing protein n=1 Tax=Nyssa sinensis TaxID=561372 RepID=A0A5J5BHV5_9ASTE|nr:hypothetical protein F0562_025353 [Nyssa sinensis]